MFSGIIHPIDDALNIIVALAALGFVVSYAISQWKTGGNKATTEAVTAYEKELCIVKQTLERISLENKEKDKQIASMQGQIKVLQSIPLVNIDSTLKEISNFNKNLYEINSKILERLDNDAVILARDTKDVAGKVEHVRTDLKK